MYQNLESIGFSNVKNAVKLREVLNEVISSPNYRYIISKDEDDIFAEYIKYFGKGIGIAVRGSFDESENMVIESWAPYVETFNKTEIIEVDIDMNEKKEYYAICEEEETGSEIEFYLQNVVDFLNIEDDEDVTIAGAYMVGLSESGTVILPIKKDFMDKVLECENDKLYRTLVRLIREGDNEAEHILQIQQEQLTETITERLEKEDVFSVIEGYFVHDDTDDLAYNILGTIQKIDKIKNTATGEKIYKLNVNAMGVIIDICINEKKILGMPMVGMRFRGKCWIQGKIVFD